MSRHTPGPWHSKVVAHVVGVGVFDRRGIHIAQVTSLRSGDDELIAQAPDLKQQRDDLLAALKDILAMDADTEGIWIHHGTNKELNELERCIGAAVAAVKRAEGKQ